MKVLTLSYGQTSSSVADFAAYTKDKADGINLVKQTIPAVLAILAAIALAVAMLMAFRDRRSPATPAVPETPVEPPKTYA